MKAVIGVLAPNAGDTQYNREFRLRLDSSGQELTLRNLHRLFESSFDNHSLNSSPVYDNAVIPASGYYLTGLLRSNGYDTRMANNVGRDALREMARHSPLAVCISTSMIVSIDSLKDITARVRAVMPGIAIIAGGPLIWKQFIWATSCESEDAADPGVDKGGATGKEWSLFKNGEKDLDVDVMVISPHGSSSLLEVLDEIQKGTKGDLASIPNIAIRDGSENFMLTRRAEEPIDWNADFTRWDLVDEMPSWVPIRTSIGCPHRCRYCDFCRMAPDLFLRSASSLAEELAVIMARNRRPIVHVTDDIVFPNRKRLKEVCQTFMDSRAVWGGFLRAAPFIPDEIELISRSRFSWGMIGVESGDQGQLDRMQKRQKVDVSRKCVEALDKAKITLLLTMLVGFPGENDQTLANTIDFLSGLDVANTSYELFPLWVFPLSALATPELRRQWQLKGIGGDWSHETMDRAGAEAACAHIFRSVRPTPYHYSDESTLFNTRWPRAVRRNLFDVRRRLTVELMDNSPRNSAAGTVTELAENMGFSDLVPPDTWMNDLTVRAGTPGEPRDAVSG